MASATSYSTLFPSAARTASPAAAVVDDGNRQRSGGHFIIDVTAIGAAPSVVFNIEAFDPASGKWYLMLASAAIVAVGTTVLRIYPGVAAAANVSVSDVLPPNWRVRPVHGNSDSITYSFGARLMD